jgi:hypothetical protein
VNDTLVAETWSILDSWWDTHLEGAPLATDDRTVQTIDKQWLTSQWPEMDTWWETHASDSLLSNGDGVETVRTIEHGWLTDQWSTLDSWWATSAETGDATAQTLLDELDRSTERWEAGDGPFETDPLGADITSQRDRGPMQPIREEDWSQWLAQLLGPSGEFVRTLFGELDLNAPSEIYREEQLPNDSGTTRRADILVWTGAEGFSIEVKLGDEHYEKTFETAKLTEGKFPRTAWTHVLLLPKDKAGRLDARLDCEIERVDGRRQLKPADAPAVTVLYWEDVTTTLRSLLQAGRVVDDHWAANAYVFCALVEQQVLGFKSRPLLKDVASPDDVIETLATVGMRDTFAQQLSYLRETDAS